MATIFSKIVAGEIPCYKVAEDAKHLAFFDVNPIAEGHVLVIPKKEVDYFWDIEGDELSDLMLFAKQVALKLKVHFPCKKIGLAVIGLEVAHAHLHLVPMQEVGDLDFGKKRIVVSENQYRNWIENMSK